MWETKGQRSYLASSARAGTSPERRQQQKCGVWLRGIGNRPEASSKEVVIEMQDWATPGPSLNTTVVKAHSKRWRKSRVQECGKQPVTSMSRAREMLLGTHSIPVTPAQLCQLLPAAASSFPTTTPLSTAGSSQICRSKRLLWIYININCRTTY